MFLDELNMTLTRNDRLKLTFLVMTILSNSVYEKVVRSAFKNIGKRTPIKIHSQLLALRRWVTKLRDYIAKQPATKQVNLQAQLYKSLERVHKEMEKMSLEMGIDAVSDMCLFLVETLKFHNKENSNLNKILDKIIDRLLKIEEEINYKLEEHIQEKGIGLGRRLLEAVFGVRFKHSFRGV